VADPAAVRGLGLAVAGVLVAGLVAAVAGDDGGVPAAGGRVTVDGRSSVVHTDGAVDRLESGDIVRSGEEVRVETGTIVVELADGGLLEGRAGGEEVPSTRLRVDDEPELLAGELLVVGDRGLTVSAAGTDVALAHDGAAARVGRSLSVVAAAYRGRLAVDSAGQQRDVPALRQIGIASLGRPPRVPEPLDVRAADPWDRRFLGAAIDLGRSLDAASAAFTSNAPPGASTSAALFETALPRLEAEASFEPALAGGPARPAGEILVGAAIASLASGGSFADRWDATFEFRDDGAGWGLVALDRGVAGEVLGEVESALGRSAEVPEVASPAGPAQPPRTTRRPAGDGDGDGDGSTSPTTSPPPTAPPTTPPPSPTIPPTTTPPLVPTVPPLPPLPSEESEDPQVIPDTGVPLLDGATQPIDDLLGGLLD